MKTNKKNNLKKIITLLSIFSVVFYVSCEKVDVKESLKSESNTQNATQRLDVEPIDSMIIQANCNARGLFCSCQANCPGGSQAVCRGRIFTCHCQCTGRTGEPGSGITLTPQSPQEIATTLEFRLLVTKLTNSPIGKINKVKQDIDLIIQSHQTNNYQLHENISEMLESDIKGLHPADKVIINQFLLNNGEIRTI